LWRSAIRAGGGARGGGNRVTSPNGKSKKGIEKKTSMLGPTPRGKLLNGPLARTNKEKKVDGHSSPGRSQTVRNCVNGARGKIGMGGAITRD